MRDLETLKRSGLRGEGTSAQCVRSDTWCVVAAASREEPARAGDPTAKVDYRWRMLSRWVPVAVPLLAISVWGCCAHRDIDEGAKPPTERMSIEAIGPAYRSNAARANALYGGKRMEVYDAQVGYIGQTGIVTFNAPGSGVPGVGVAACGMAKGDSGLMYISVGQKGVSFVGTIGSWGPLVPSVGAPDTLWVSDCRIVPARATNLARRKRESSPS